MVQTPLTIYDERKSEENDVTQVVFGPKLGQGLIVLLTPMQVAENVFDEK